LKVNIIRGPLFNKRQDRAIEMLAKRLKTKSIEEIQFEGEGKEGLSSCNDCK
jgi:hypothetical protein